MSFPYKRTCKIVVLFILRFVFYICYSKVISEQVRLERVLHQSVYAILPLNFRLELSKEEQDVGQSK